MKEIGIAIIFLLIFGESTGQNWINAHITEGVNLYQANEEFHNYWKDKDVVKGLGYKQFNRWKGFWEPRLFPSGDFISEDVGFELYRSTSGTDKSGVKNFGNWESIGIDSWTSHSYNPGNGRVNCIYQDPVSSDIIYIGSASGGLWRTSDQGNSWEPLTDEIPTLGISGIAVDYTNSNVIYIATGDSENHDVYGVGVLKSVDGGVTWGTTGLTWGIAQQRTAVKLIMHPTNPQILYCATSVGVKKTINGGLTWYTVLSGNINDIEFKPNDPNILYCTRKKIYKSVDGGESFEAIVSDSLPLSTAISTAKIGVTAANPEVIYYFCADNAHGFKGLYRSNDSGVSWELQSDYPNVLEGSSTGQGVGGQAWYDMAIAISPDDENTVIVGGINLWKSTTGGTTWTLNSYWFYEDDMPVNYVHADIHHLEYVGGNLYCGTDGGIFISTDNSSTYEDLSSGLEITQFTKLGVSEQNSELIIAGAQDNGTNIFSGDTWGHSYGGDGGECAFIASDSMIVFCSTQNGGIRKSTDGGQNFSSSTVGISEEGAWITPFVISPLNDDYIYAAFQNVWRSSSQGESWSKISDIDEYLHSIAIGMNDPNTVYAASYGDIYRTNNGGNDWDNISSGLPNVAITGIVVDPLNINHIWITFSGFSNGNKVFYSANGGDDWDNISDNLPNVPVNCIVFDDQGDNGVYIGTDTGIFYTNDNLAHWEPFMNNFPNVIVTELEIHYDDQMIFASTFGRGLWKSNLFSIDEVPLVGFTFSPALICEGMSIDFFDQSALGTSEWNWNFEGAVSSISTEMNPVVVYENEGDYDVSLTITNSVGESTYLCENCIHVFAENSLELPYEENFESTEVLNDMLWSPLSDGWKLSNNTGASGSQSLWVENYQLNSNDDYEIISQPIFLNTSQVFFMFKYSYAQIDPSNNDVLRLYSSSDCGNSWSLRNTWAAPSSLTPSDITLEAFFPTSNSDWQQVVLELDNSLLGQDVMFKFRFQDKGGNNIFIDDINISSEPLSVFNSLTENKVFVYPNPAKNLLQVSGIKTKNCFIKIYNSFGALVEESPLFVENINFIDLEYLVDGVYVYKIVNSKQELFGLGKITVLK